MRHSRFAADPVRSVARRATFTRRVVRAAMALLIVAAPSFAHAADNDDVKPLRPMDTSSPRATLQTFIQTGDEIYRDYAEALRNYAASDRLYLSKQELDVRSRIVGLAPKAVGVLDSSHILPILATTVPIERAIQLKGIFDRIDLPAPSDVPDRETMDRLGTKRWRLPDTEIDFVLMETGPRAGEYLVSADTVDRIPEFYDRVKDLPYKSGAARDLAAVLQSLHGGRPVTIYDAILNSPVGLDWIVPPRWVLQLPQWARFRVADVSAWQWGGLGLGALVAVLLIVGALNLARRWAGAGDDDRKSRWHMLPVPFAILFIVAVLAPVICAVFRIGGAVRVIIAYAETGVLYLTIAWLCVIGSILLADVVVSSEHLKRRSLDRQLVRLAARLVGLAVAIGVLIQGADRLGLPAYSVLAGLGVGGLAVALAARDSIANLLGSLLILFEQPFRVGHYVKVGGNEGTVEDVGFRSTRIRTPDNSLVSIPNNTVVNTTIENLTLRTMRRHRFVVSVTYDTPRDKVEALTANIRQLLLDHALTDKGSVQVRFNNLGESSLDILVMFCLTVDDSGTDMQEHEAILLRIMEFAEDLGISFAFPTRRLVVETAAAATRPAPAATLRSLTS